MNDSESNFNQLPLVDDELEVLRQMVNLSNQAIIELGCGNARLSRSLLALYPNCKVTGLEVDAVQHAKNLFHLQRGIEFVEAGAQNVPFPDDTFDLALMLKSLHHVPIDLMDQALEEVARVLRTGSLFYVSEPIYAGALNDIVRLYNDEGIVRSAAQMALDRAIAKQLDWVQVEDGVLLNQFITQVLMSLRKECFTPVLQITVLMLRCFCEFKKHLHLI